MSHLMNIFAEETVGRTYDLSYLHQWQSELALVTSNPLNAFIKSLISPLGTFHQCYEIVDCEVIDRNLLMDVQNLVKKFYGHLHSHLFTPVSCPKRDSYP